MMKRNFQAIRITASTVGVLAGLVGLEHGFFETLQGNVAPGSININAIGAANRFWPGGGEPAMTLVPNFLATGLLAMLISLLMIVWAVGFLHKKFGNGMLILLAVTQLLVGGGFAPPFLAILTALAASCLNKSLGRCQTRVPTQITYVLAKFWPWLFATFLLSYCMATELAIFGFFFGADNRKDVLYTFAGLIPVLFALTMITGWAHDIQRLAKSGQVSLENV
jgi:hypothetical protein